MISIIIPVYNVEPYIRKCIDSILNQTYRDLQIILVDDESTDRSGEICDRYAVLDKRITVFHQKHEGPSASRNVGLKHAKGEYIGFVDSDDWCEPEMFEKMLIAMETHSVDAVRCNFNTIYKKRITPFVALLRPLKEYYLVEKAL